MAEIGRLFATAQAIDDPGDLLALARAHPGTPLFFWEHPARGEAMLALGVVREICTRAPGVCRRGGGRGACAGDGGGGRRYARTCASSADSRSPIRSRAARGCGVSARPPGAAAAALGAIGAGTMRIEVRDEGDAAFGVRAAAASPVVPAALHLRAPALGADERSRWRTRVERVRASSAPARSEGRAGAPARLAADDVVDPATLLRGRARRAPACFNFWVRAGRRQPDRHRRPSCWYGARAHRRRRARSPARRRGRRSRADGALAAAFSPVRRTAREHAIVVAAVRDALTPLADASRVAEARRSCRCRRSTISRPRSRARLRAPPSVLDMAAAAPDARGLRHAAAAGAAAASRARSPTAAGTPAPSAGWTRAATASSRSRCAARSSRAARDALGRRRHRRRLRRRCRARRDREQDERVGGAVSAPAAPVDAARRRTAAPTDESARRWRARDGRGGTPTRRACGPSRRRSRRAGVSDACISPGSRSTAAALALVRPAVSGPG